MYNLYSTTVQVLISCKTLKLECRLHEFRDHFQTNDMVTKYWFEHRTDGVTNRDCDPYNQTFDAGIFQEAILTVE